MCLEQHLLSFEFVRGAIREGELFSRKSVYLVLLLPDVLISIYTGTGLKEVTKRLTAVPTSSAGRVVQSDPGNCNFIP